MEKNLAASPRAVFIGGFLVILVKSTGTILVFSQDGEGPAVHETLASNFKLLLIFGCQYLIFTE